jgi:hypothetical protein
LTNRIECIKFVYKCRPSSKTKIFEFSPHPCLPAGRLPLSPCLPAGRHWEREGVRGQNVRRKFSDLKMWESKKLKLTFLEMKGERVFYEERESLEQNLS